MNGWPKVRQPAGGIWVYQELTHLTARLHCLTLADKRSLTTLSMDILLQVKLQSFSYLLDEMKSSKSFQMISVIQKHLSPLMHILLS